MDDDGFIKVTYRAAKYKKRKLFKHNATDYSALLSYGVQKDPVTIINDVNKQKNLMHRSEFFSQFSGLLTKALRSIQEQCEGHDLLLDVICYGLGTFATQAVTCPQMALLLLIKDIINCSVVQLYDPQFTEIDSEVLRQLNCCVIGKNEEGKRKIQRRTIFYLPHCPWPLFNSILWANWRPENLRKIVLIGNSLTKFITDSCLSNRSALQQKYSYIYKVLPAVVEYDIPNSFHSQNVFYNFTIITFDAAILQTFTEDKWQNINEPFYISGDEIIVNKTLIE